MENRIGKLCPIRDVISCFSDKWSLLVLVVLYESSEGKLRFSQLEKQIEAISHRMLTVTLRSLESNGLISRHIYPEVPPRVEYELTDIGRSLIPHLRSLVDWALENIPTIVRSRQEFIS